MATEMERRKKWYVVRVCDGKSRMVMVQDRTSTIPVCFAFQFVKCDKNTLLDIPVESIKSHDVWKASAHSGYSINFDQLYS